MDMNMGYWILEYGKVFCGYLFLMFLWPSVVFHSHLKGKSKTWRFGFCVTVPIVIMNTVVMVLGLFHVLSQWIVCLLFYGSFVLALVKNTAAYLDGKYKSMMEAKFPDVRTLKGKYRELVLVLLFFIVCFKYVKRAAGYLSIDYLKKIKTCNWTKIRVQMKQGIWNLGRVSSSMFWRYGILAIVIIFGMLYFNYGAFQVYSYGYGDLYTHHGWIYALIQGNVFPEGVYPEAMHCFIYCMHTVLGIKVYSILLFLQGIHVAVFLISAYLLLRKVFSWRYTPLFVLMLFLTLDLNNADLIQSMFRLQITLPQEFALHSVCLCALYLTEYLKCGRTSDAVEKKRGIRNYFRDENLFLFMMSCAVAAMVHFHTLLMAAVVCTAFAVFEVKKIFKDKYLLPLVSSILCAGLIAVTPMAGALAQGIPFNASIDWAVSAMGGAESRAIRNQSGNDKDADTIERGNVGDAENAVEDGSGEEAVQELQRNEISITATLLRGVAEIFDKGYSALYGKSRGGWMLVLTAVAVAFCWLTRRKEKFIRFRETAIGYPPVILGSVLYILIYAAPMIGLPDLLPEGRFFAPGHMMMLGVVMMPIDVLFSGMLHFGKELVLKGASLLLIVGIYGGMIATGNFRGLLFYELSRYNAAAMVTEEIINTFPKYSYTIVSPTDELYPVVQYGWHEELLNFVENINSEGYSIPSEYVFIYVEKKPLLYAQSHFFQGPWWMGEEKYLKPFWDVYSHRYPDSAASQNPEIIAGQVSEEEAAGELPAYENAWLMYLKLPNRSVLESKAYDWCQQFARKHPSVLNVFYEDDAFVCYYFRQDMGNPAYELGME